MFSFYIPFVLLFVLHFSNASNKKPIVSEIRFPSELTEGQRVVITCSVLEGFETLITIYWLKNNQKINFNNNKEEDISEHSFGPQFGSSLLFHSLKSRDSGLYTCFARNQFGNSSSSARLQVRVKPHFIIQPNNTTALLGQTVRFDCQSDGFPVPIIRWKLKTDSFGFRSLQSNYRLQSLENGSLLINNVNKEDSGFYSCEASNGVSADISRQILLSVHTPPYFKHEYHVTRVRIGAKFEIKCKAFGDKPISIEWSRDQQEEEKDLNSFGFKFKKEENNGEESVTSILISENGLNSNNSSKLDLICQANNRFGQSQQKHQLIIESLPFPPKDISIIELDSHHVTIQWSYPLNDGNSKILKYLIKLEEIEEQRESRVWETTDREIQLNNLIGNKFYKIILFSFNYLGKSLLGKEFSFKTKELEIKTIINNLKANVLNSQQINVFWFLNINNLIEKEENINGFYIGFKSLNEKQFTFNTIERKDFQQKDFNHVISGLKANTKYQIFIQKFNKKGVGPQSKELLVQTFAYDSPFPPILSINNNINYNDITIINITWSLIEEENQIISSFHLFRRILPFDWSKNDSIKIEDSIRYILITDLICGEKTEFFITAHNDIGSSPPSNIISRDLTKYSVGVAPTLQELLKVNSTRVDLNLNNWKNCLNCCRVKYFRIKYKILSIFRNTFVEKSENISRDSILSLHHLKPGIWYSLIVSAHFSKYVYTEKEYLFSTLTSEGGTIPPMTALSSSNQERRLSRYFIVLVPVSCAVSVLLVIGFVVIFIQMKRNQNQYQMTSSLNQTTSLSMNELKTTKKIRDFNHENSLEENSYDFPLNEKHLNQCSNCFID